MPSDRTEKKPGAKSYREFHVWQRGMDLCEAIYKVTARLPKEEVYGLTSQLRRASVSIPSNIAEGFGREQRGSFAQHLRISQGSLKELETQLLICQRVNLIPAEDVDRLLSMADEIGKMTRSLIRSLQD